MNITGVILAAGASTRMTKNKQLLTYQGKSFIKTLAAHTQQLELTDCMCITGFLHTELKEELSDYPLSFYNNSNYKKGLLSSLQLAIQQAQQKPSCEAILVMLSDQPLIPMEHYQLLIHFSKTRSENIIASAYRNTYGVPVIYKKKYFAKILALKESQSPKTMIKENLSDSLFVRCEKAQYDIDTDQEYQNLIQGHYE